MKILFVVTAFYPEQAIGAVRITKFAKYLKSKGDDLTVLSLTPVPWANRDESLYFSALDTMRWEMIAQSALFRRFFLKARVAAVGAKSAVGTVKPDSSNGGFRSKLKQFSQLVYTLLKACDWMIQVRRYAKRNLVDEKFDVIFTSYPSLASPLCGLMLKRMGISESVVTDFRDPLSYGTGGIIDIKRRIQNFIVNRSSLLVFTSNGFKNMVLSPLKSNGCTIDNIVLNNGFDPDDCSLVKDFVFQNQGRFRIVYTGSLYGGKRDITPLFSAVSSVLERKGWSTDVVEFHYAGPESRLFHEICDQWGFSRSVLDHGLISRSESLGLQKASDLCVVATWNTAEDQGVLTGKIFECFMLRKPVLGIVSGNLANSEIGEVIDEIGAGFCYEIIKPDEFSLMTEWLAALMENKLNRGLVEDSYNSKVNNFSFEENVNALRRALKASMNKSSGVAAHD